MDATHQIFEFEGFRLDAAQRSIYSSSGARISVTPKAFDALLFLIENAGAVVDKKRLMNAVWPSLVVEENNLNQCVAAVRRALGDDRSKSRFIATVPGRGYQFVAEVTRSRSRTSVAVRERPRSVNAEAYQQHLLGWYHWHRPSPGSVQLSMSRYERAIELDPKFALAYAGLAGAYVLLALYGLRAPTDVYPKARDLCEAALRIDPMCCELHIWMSQIRRQFDHDWAGSSLHAELALKLNAEEPLAHFAMGMHLATVGRMPEATDAMRRAYELEPLSVAISACLGMVFYYSRRYDEAVAQLRETLEVHESFDLANSCLGRAYLMQGKHEEALSHFQRCTATSPGSRADIARALALTGRRDEARRACDALVEESRLRYVSAYDLAAVHVALGSPDDAFASLLQAASERAPLLWFLAADPALDPIRGDPRFARLLADLKLPLPGDC